MVFCRSLVLRLPLPLRVLSKRLPKGDKTKTEKGRSLRRRWMENAMARMMMMKEEADQRDNAKHCKQCYALNEGKENPVPIVMNENATNALYRARTATPTAPNNAAL
jgi:hypothetical protein